MRGTLTDPHWRSSPQEDQTTGVTGTVVVVVDDVVVDLSGRLVDDDDTFPVVMAQPEATRTKAVARSSLHRPPTSTPPLCHH